VLLAEILRRHPGTRGVLFNLPAVIASARRTIAPSLIDRIEFVAGDFFHAVPAGGDVYILKNILHDWADTDATRILAACRLAMTPTARLLIIEHFVCAPNQRCAGTIGDVQMMVRTGGRNRTVPEMTRLLATAGFQSVVTQRTTGGPDLMVGTATVS
jgi:hypothetical protein